MGKTEYSFNALDTDYHLSGSCHIREVEIDTPLFYGKCRTLFGVPVYESENLENQFTYCIEYTSNSGKSGVLSLYSGPSGPAVGGFPSMTDEDAVDALIKLLEDAKPSDYDYSGYYLDFEIKVDMGVKDGKPYKRVTELDLSPEEMEKLFNRVVLGKDD